jgi:phosphopantetheine--protein transferase-like protein
MPVCHDFRKDHFYTMNFTPSEIAYCILRADPYASFAGLFSAKEAVIKAGLRARPFNKIEIAHLADGKPVFPGFQLSISHAGQVAVAVAVGSDVAEDHPAPLPLPVKTGAPGPGGRMVAWLALLLSAIAFILIFTR